jgi:hypothetical protein
MVLFFRGRIRSAHQEGALAMIEDGLSRAEIAEYPGINFGWVKDAKVKPSARDNPRERAAHLGNTGYGFMLQHS